MSTQMERIEAHLAEEHERLLAKGLKCPKCDGTQGFYYEFVDRYTQYITFEGTPDGASEGSPVWTSARLRCTDCGANITKYIRSLGIEV